MSSLQQAFWEMDVYGFTLLEQVLSPLMDEFAESYLGGATPVPCIRCNERVKFKDLLETAKDLEADCMATGHYIQRKMGEAGPELHAAADANVTGTIRHRRSPLCFAMGT